jgi:hypothetical protein
VYPCGGRELLERIAHERPRLSPTMQVIGDYCIRAHARLHRVGIEEVAAQCGAAPSSVVRFARLFGHKGYQDFKTAFLQGAALLADPRIDAATPPAVWPAGPCAHLLKHLDEDVAQLSELQTLILGREFQQAVRWMQGIPGLTLTYRGEFDRLVAIHLGNALQRVGKQVSLVDWASQSRWRFDACLGIQIAIDLEQVVEPVDNGSRLREGHPGRPGRMVLVVGLVVHPDHAHPEPDRLVLSIAGSSLGRRVQKALSMVNMIEVALG